MHIEHCSRQPLRLRKMSPTAMATDKSSTFNPPMSVRSPSHSRQAATTAWSGRFWPAQSFQDSGTDCSNVGSYTYMHSFPTTVDHWTIAHVHKNPTNCKHACWPWPHPHKKGVGLQCRSNTLPTTAHCQVRHKANSPYVCMYVCTYQMDGINSRV